MVYHHTTLFDFNCFSNKKKKKKNKQKTSSSSSTATSWKQLSPEQLWGKIKDEAKQYFDYDITMDNVDEVVEQTGIQKISLLRRLCIVMGIQVG